MVPGGVVVPWRPRATAPQPPYPESFSKREVLWGDLGSDFRFVKELIAKLAIPSFHESWAVAVT